MNNQQDGFNLHLSETQNLIAETVRNFAHKEILPHVMEWDEAQHFPVELFHKMGELGIMGVLIPEAYGGAGLSYFEYISVVSEIAKVCGSIGLSVAAHNSLCTNHIYEFGNEEQRKKWLPKLASGEWIGAWALTEPGTGSDAGNMSTTAVKDGDYWVLNGTKTWITHGGSGNIVVAIVRTGERGDSHGMTAFAIEKTTPGISGGRKENKLGMRASETCQVIFENCRVHKDCMLGKEGEGFVQSMKILDGGRISIAALSLGIAKGAYEHSVKYAQEREQFNRPIASFQGVSFKLADMATNIAAAELLTLRAADMKNKKQKMTQEAAMAKYYASEVSVQVATDALQIFGGNGYTKQYPVEKYYRDSKLCTIGEGTSEIQKIVIAREALKKA